MIKVYYPDGGFYEGSVIDEKRNGIGIYKLENSVYDGEFADDNFISGKITLIIDFQTELALQYSFQTFKRINEHEQNQDNNNTIAFFQRSANSDNAECICYIGAQKIFRYSGSIAKGLWDKQGQLETPTWYYNGQFASGKLFGVGLWQQLNVGCRYHGQINNNLPEGQGEFIFGQTKYKGQFSNGYISGNGKLQTECYDISGNFTKYLLDSDALRVLKISKGELYSRYVFQLDLYENQILNNLSEIQRVIYNLLGDKTDNSSAQNEEQNIELLDQDLEKSTNQALSIPYSIDPLLILENPALWKGILDISIDNGVLQITLESGLVFKGHLVLDNQQKNILDQRIVSFEDINKAIQMTKFDTLLDAMSKLSSKSPISISSEEQEMQKVVYTHKQKEKLMHIFQHTPHQNLITQIQGIETFFNQLDLTKCKLDGQLILPDCSGSINEFLMFQGKIFRAKGMLKDQVFQYDFDYTADECYINKINSAKLNINEYKQTGKFTFQNDAINFTGARTEFGYTGMFMDKKAQITCSGNFTFNFKKQGQCNVSFKNNKIMEAFFDDDQVLWDKKVLYDNKQIQVTNNKLIIMRSDNEKLLICDKMEIDIQARKILAILGQYTRQDDEETENIIDLYINPILNTQFGCYQYTNTLNDIKIGQFLGTQLQGFGLKQCNGKDGVYFGQFNNDDLISGTIIKQKAVYIGKHQGEKLQGKGLAIVFEKKKQTFLGYFQSNVLHDECKILFKCSNPNEQINYYGLVNSEYLISGQGLFMYEQYLCISGIYQEQSNYDYHEQETMTLSQVYQTAYQKYENIDILVGNLIANNTQGVLQNSNRSLALSSVFTNTFQTSQVSFELLQGFSQQIYAIASQIIIPFLQIEDIQIKCLNLQKIELLQHGFSIELIQTTGQLLITCMDFSVKFIPQQDDMEIAMKISEYVKMDVNVYLSDDKQFHLQKGIIHNLQTNEKVSFGDNIIQETQDYLFNADNDYFGILTYKHVNVQMMGQFSKQNQLIFGIIIDNQNKTTRIGCFTAGQDQLGFGIFITPDFIYAGELNEGQFDGPGQLYLCNKNFDELVQQIKAILNTKINITSFQQYLSKIQISDYIANIPELKYYEGNFEGNQLVDQGGSRYYHQINFEIIQEFTGHIYGFKLQSGILTHHGIKINGHCIDVDIWKGDLHFKKIYVTDGKYIISGPEVKIAAGKLQFQNLLQLQFEFLTISEAKRSYFEFLRQNIVPSIDQNNTHNQYTIQQPEINIWSTNVEQNEEQDLKLSGLKVIDTLQDDVLQSSDVGNFSALHNQSVVEQSQSMYKSQEQVDSLNKQAYDNRLSEKYNEENINYTFSEDQQLIKITDIQDNYLIFLGNLYDFSNNVNKLTDSQRIMVTSGLLNHKDFCYIGDFEIITDENKVDQQLMIYNDIYYRKKQGYFVFWNYGFTFRGKFENNAIDTGKILISKGIDLQILQQQIQNLGHKQLGMTINSIIPLLLEKQQVNNLQINIDRINSINMHIIMAQSPDLSFIYDTQTKTGFIFNLNAANIFNTVEHNGVYIQQIVGNYIFQTDIISQQIDIDNQKDQSAYNLQLIQDFMNKSSQIISFRNTENNQFEVVHQHRYLFKGKWKIFSFINGEFHDTKRDIIMKGQFNQNQLINGQIQFLNLKQLNQLIQKLDIQFCNYVNDEFNYQNMKLDVVNGSFAIQKSQNSIISLINIWSSYENNESTPNTQPSNNMQKYEQWLEILQIMQNNILLTIYNEHTVVVITTSAIIIAGKFKCLKLRLVDEIQLVQQLISPSSNDQQQNMNKLSQNNHQETKLFKKQVAQQQEQLRMQNISSLFDIFENFEHKIQEILYLSDSVTFTRNAERVRLEEIMNDQNKQLMELNIEASKSVIKTQQFKFKGSLSFDPRNFSFQQSLEYLDEGLLLQGQAKLSGQFKHGHLNGYGVKKDETGLRNGIFVDGELASGRFQRNDGVIFDICQ